jgi:ABC-type dipeptide/oligopeptide/nickel transport system ATPase subunit
MQRVFVAKPAVRESVPLLIGLMGPSGSGKTFSALRLATGIQKITGGEIYGIDTESRRMLHYADQFKFRHIQFDAPFGSLDYLAAMRHCIEQGAKVVIVDSMTHEHSGPGGYLQTQDAEVERMAGNDAAKRERVRMAAWIKPAQLRSQMITGLLQLNANFVFCFRAKEKTKPVKGGGVVEMGYMPVAGDELLYEMTVNCLLPPKSNGVPQWRSDMVGERLMMKLPEQFKAIFAENKSLDENIGQALALWAKGTAAESSDAVAAVESVASPPQPQVVPPGEAADDSFVQVEGNLKSAASEGMAALEGEWKSLSRSHRLAFKEMLPTLKAAATQIDMERSMPDEPQ